MPTMEPGPKFKPGRKSAAADLPERRKNARHPFAAEASIGEPGSRPNLQAHTGDLSAGGCYIDTMNPMPAGSEIQVALSKNGKAFRARARVVYSHDSMGMGLLFQQTDLSQRAILHEWLAERDPESASDPRLEIERDWTASSAPARTNERYALEELLSLLMEKHVVTEDEGERILYRLRE